MSPELHNTVLSRMAIKGGISFYAAVIRAIIRSPKFPLSSLRSFKSLVDPTTSGITMKFAMVGDRQINDIVPPLRLLSDKRLITIRLNSGRYAIEEHIARQEADWPSYVTHPLAQTKAILLSRQTWQDITCIDDPPIFNLPIDCSQRDHMPTDIEDPDFRVGIDHILNGVGVDAEYYPTIHRISFGILWEYLMRCPDADKENILSTILNVNDDDYAWDHIRRRDRVLCSFSYYRFARNSTFLKELKERLCSRLDQDLRWLHAARTNEQAGVSSADRERLISMIESTLRDLDNRDSGGSRPGCVASGGIE